MNTITTQATILRRVAKCWEQTGSCPGFYHILACAIAKQALKARKLPMFDDIGFLILAFGFAAEYLEGPK